MNSYRFVSFVAKFSVFLVVAITAWYFAADQQIDSWSKAYHQREYYQAELERLEQEINELHKRRTALARGGFEAEKAIRERFLYAREGEMIYQGRTLLEEEAAATKSP